MSSVTSDTDILIPAGDDSVRPYAVSTLDVRGRAVQMGPVLDEILGRHNYPDAVARLLAEAIILTALLGTSLKFDGKFSLQTETDGPVSMLVVDYRTTGVIRAYARFDEARLSADQSASQSTGQSTGANSGALMGEGVMAMTIDQGSSASRYQGIVPLHGEGLEAAAHTYFLQSEQIPTRVRLAAAQLQRRGADGVTASWRAGGVLVQYLPGSSEHGRSPDLPGGDAPEDADFGLNPHDELWTEALALADTVEDIELTDPDVPIERLLFRLFNERGVRVFPASALRDECSCSRDRVRGVLTGFTEEEIINSTENGVISVGCEFCARTYDFDPDSLGKDHDA
jgi:molecular chaperone Hsp33